MDTHNTHIRAVRPPPGSRRNLFHSQSTRRQNPTTVRPDGETAGLFQQPQADELVERTPQGDYVIHAPTTYQQRAMTMEREADEEDEQEQQIIDLYGKQNPHWDAEAVDEEIKNALKSSLKKMVTAMEEDEWMFAREKDLGKK